MRVASMTAAQDIADVRHLRAKVVMHEPEAVEHVMLLQGIIHIDDLGRGQAEGGTLAAGIRTSGRWPWWSA